MCTILTLSYRKITISILQQEFVPPATANKINIIWSTSNQRKQPKNATHFGFFNKPSSGDVKHWSEKKVMKRLCHVGNKIVK
jgi:hypothetical protein